MDYRRPCIFLASDLDGADTSLILILFKLPESNCLVASTLKPEAIMATDFLNGELTEGTDSNFSLTGEFTSAGSAYFWHISCNISEW
jgi:hypothetical protein